MLGKHVKELLNFVTSAPKQEWTRNFGYQMDHIKLAIVPQVWQFCKFVMTSGYVWKLLLRFAFSIDVSVQFFSTFLWNDMYSSWTVAGHCRRYVVWKFRGWLGEQHPVYMDDKDGKQHFVLMKIVEELLAFFIRKIKYTDSPLIDLVDNRWRDETLLWQGWGKMS